MVWANVDAFDSAIIDRDDEFWVVVVNAKKSAKIKSYLHVVLFLANSPFGRLLPLKLSFGSFERKDDIIYEMNVSVDGSKVGTTLKELGSADGHTIRGFNDVQVIASEALNLKRMDINSVLRVSTNSCNLHSALEVC